jgi:dUTP pyrophosphatase
MQFAKLLGHARPPTRLHSQDAGVSVFSAEDFKLEYGETHAYRTGIVLNVPEGMLAHLVRPMVDGTKGCVVAGQCVTAKDRTELRVTLLNNHREALEVRAGDPIAQLVLGEVAGDDEMEEVGLDELRSRMASATEKAQASFMDDRAKTKGRMTK